MKKQFAVMGLGGFGESVARELMRLGHEVLGVDIDENLSLIHISEPTRPY